MPYFIDTTKLYRIWFSDDPDCFMNEENKLRFIRLRVKNPKATLSLLYSSKCLSMSSREQLKAFCEKLDIKPIDFDSDIPGLLTDEQDIQIYELAKQEIVHTPNNNGGNLASASDCARTLLPVLQRCGLYADFDVEVDFSKAPSVVEIKAPVILNTYFKPHIYGGVGGPNYNNDFLGLSYDSPDLSKLSLDAISDLRKLQAQILQNYQKITPQSIYDYKPMFTEVSKVLTADTIGKALIRKYLEKNPQCSIFDIRRFIQSLTVEFVVSNCQHLPPKFDEEKLKALKWEMNWNTVISTAGPGAYSALFAEFLDQEFSIVTIEEIRQRFPSWYTRQRDPWGYSSLWNNVCEVVRTIMPRGQWMGYKNRCLEYGLPCNGLDKYVICKQNDAKFDEIFDGRNPLEEDIGLASDMSWTAIGADNQKKRSAKIADAVKTLQHGFRLWIEKERLQQSSKLEKLVLKVEKLTV